MAITPAETNPPTFNPSLIIEFDTWVNGLGDPNEDHIALQRDGTNDHTGPDCLAGPGGQRHQQQHRGWAGPPSPYLESGITELPV